MKTESAIVKVNTSRPMTAFTLERASLDIVFFV